MVLNYVALGVIAFLAIIFAWVIVQLGSLPGKIAHRRGHPQPDAVNAASWISFLTLGALWPIAFVWAFFRYGDSPAEQKKAETPSDELKGFESRLATLEATVSQLQPKSGKGES